MAEHRIRVTSTGNSHLEIAFESFGDESAEPILLICGLGSQMVRWTSDFCSELAAKGYRVIRFDNRDVGRSDDFAEHGTVDFEDLAAMLRDGHTPELPYELDDMAADSVGLLDALSIHRAHVVGRSMGGMIAQIIASECPIRVRSLTSIMSGTGNPAMPPPRTDVMRMMTGRTPDPRIDEAAFVEHGVSFARLISGKGFPFNEGESRSVISQELKRGYVHGGVGRQMAAMAVAGDRRARLAAIKCPSLVIHGSDDPLIPAACGQDTVASIRSAQWMPINGMGHDVPAWSIPRKFVRTI